MPFWNLIIQFKTELLQIGIKSRKSGSIAFPTSLKSIQVNTRWWWLNLLSLQNSKEKKLLRLCSRHSKLKVFKYKAKEYFLYTQVEGPQD